jgi:hypothetical protein
VSATALECCATAIMCECQCEGAIRPLRLNYLSLNQSQRPLRDWRPGRRVDRDRVADGRCAYGGTAVSTANENDRGAMALIRSLRGLRWLGGALRLISMRQVHKPSPSGEQLRVADVDNGARPREHTRKRTRARRPLNARARARLRVRVRGRLWTSPGLVDTRVTLPSL